jgi:hypothetical protein
MKSIKSYFPLSEKAQAAAIFGIVVFIVLFLMVLVIGVASDGKEALEADGANKAAHAAEEIWKASQPKVKRRQDGNTYVVIDGVRYDSAPRVTAREMETKNAIAMARMEMEVAKHADVYANLRLKTDLRRAIHRQCQELIDSAFDLTPE